MYCAVCARVIGRSLHRPGVKEFYDATPLREPQKIIFETREDRIYRAKGYDPNPYALRF